MNAKEIIGADTFKSSCDEETPDPFYCENLSQGKPCKEINICETYKRWKNNLPTTDKTKDKNMEYLHD